MTRNQPSYQREKKREVLEQGKLRGYEYVIMDMGTHPTAYVRIPKNHPLHGRELEEHADLDVYGGITFAEQLKKDELVGLGAGFWVGWDYAHAGDYICFKDSRLRNEQGTKWQTEEIRLHCLEVCKQLEAKDENKNE